MLICPHCQGWRRHAEDRFCGHCGRSFVTVSATVTPQYTYVGQNEGAAPVLSVALRNDGPIDPAGTVVRLRDDARDQDVGAETVPADTLIAIGDGYTLNLPLPPTGSGQRWRGRLVYDIPGGSERRVLCELDFGLPDPVLGLADEVVEPNGAGGGGARATVRLKLVAGELAPIKAVTIEAGGGPGGVTLTPPTLPHRLYRNASLALHFDLSPEAMQRLHMTPAGWPITLAVTIADRAEPIRLYPRLRVRTPAQPVVNTLNRVRALAGRTGRITVEVTNNGGSACTIQQIIARLNCEGELITTPTAMGGSDAVVEPGATVKKTVAVPLRTPQGREMPPRTYFVELQVTFLGDGVTVPPRTVALEVRPTEPFQGYIAIDFGTTETAVAYLRQEEPGQPHLLGLSETGDFVPTTIAYSLDPADPQNLRIEIGEAARHLAETDDSGSMVVFDNLKWRIGSPERLSLPNGRQATWIDVAADYLRLLKARIEEHPSIAASVNRVYPTRPARFSSPATAGLRAAFAKAGLNPMAVASGEGRTELISESWSPMILVQPLAQLQAVQAVAVGPDPILGPAFNGAHAVLTYDVGGGSTDVSLFVVEIANRATITTREVATDGTTHLCGNRIAALLYDHLTPSLDRWLERNGVPRFRVPIHLPWDEVPPGGIDPVAARNGRAVARLLRALQDGGSEVTASPFRAMIGKFVAQFGADQDVDPEVETVGKWLTIYRNTELATKPPTEAALELTTAGGETLSVPWGPDSLSLDLKDFIADFRATVAAPMLALLKAVLATETGSPGQKLHVLVSGRGSLFPLVPKMIDTHLRAILGKRPFTSHRIYTDFLKRITCQGALHLAELNLNSTGLSFRSEASTLFGILGDIDPNSGRRQFLKLCDGYPLPENGVLAVKRPLPPGDLDRRVEFGVATREGDVETAHFRQEFSLFRQIALTPAQAANTHVVVEARHAHCLIVSLGWPRQPGEAANPATFETVPFGTLALIAGACAEADDPAPETGGRVAR